MLKKILFSSAVGLLAYVGPVLISHARTYEAPLFPLIRTAVENYSLLTAFSSLLSGSLLGFLFREKFWLWGLSTVALLPTAAVLEMLVDPTSHNLWPLEFMIYAVETVPACLGALVGSKLRKF